VTAPTSVKTVAHETGDVEPFAVAESSAPLGHGTVGRSRQARRWAWAAQHRARLRAEL